ncbi:aldo/keto reductase [Bifidobacterium avesanii]|uniref:Aldo/keto reductase n=1 Tax=Bifidobacterium avesanii TaxID=1798157 RepID=A0A7K3TJH0_9BIFI|nr:aldo/keto reductase [Bifidobacterium avesanii]KAB8288544.1 glyoxal reductase [Bifidobacterium avesanii]NEG79267.1 aldo/keto reductase [Bifidobacterium avesanii]
MTDQSAVAQPTVTLNNGITIPQLGLGVFRTKEGEETVDAVRWALEAGYRHIDTARAYNNEESVGQGMRESGVKRRDVFLTTKLWNQDVRDGRARDAFFESLDRLGTDYVDLYLIHWPANGWQKAWEQMEELYNERRIRAIGVSNFHRHHIEELRSFSDLTPAADQIESSPQFPNQELIDWDRSQGIAVEAWSPLGGTGGSLLDNPTVAAVAAKYGKSPAQAIIRWHLQRGVVVIPKSIHAERIRQNFDVFDFTLSDDDMHALSNLGINRRQGSDPDNFNF